VRIVPFRVRSILQVPTVAEQAVDSLTAAAAAAADSDSSAPEGLSDEAQQLLLDLTAWPDCLTAALPRFMQHMQLHDAAVMWAKAAAPSSPASLDDVLAAPHSSQMQQRLVQELGDLEKVWSKGHYEQQEMLELLPLPAMQLLLSSSQLKVKRYDVVDLKYCYEG
jgi:hypothetical protein